jgi:translocation and assembly module TamB
MSKTVRFWTKLRNYLLIPVATLLVLALIGLGGAKYYLSSGAAATKVSNRLEAILGVPVKVGGADIGLTGGSSLSNAQVYEAEGGKSDEPWLTVKQVRADVATADLLRGANPEQLTLTGVDVRLRFAEDGALLTKLPRPGGDKGEALPRIHIEQGRVTLDQVGRNPMVVTGITGDLSRDGKALTLNGTVDDPYWQKWAMSATADGDGETELNLKTPQVRVTQEMLDRLPFVPRSVCGNVQAAGVTPVDFTLRYDPASPGVKYRVEATPRDAQVKVPIINVDADRASGHVTVADGLVELRDVKGRFADGDIVVPSADLDLRRTPAHMTFNVAVKGLDLEQLRERWPILKSVPAEKGRVTGEAKNLEVTVRDGKPHTTGSGEGVVDTVLFDRPAQIKLQLHAEGEGFRLHLPKPNPGGASLLPGPVQTVAVRADGDSAEGEQIAEDLAADIANFITRGVADGGAMILRRAERFFGGLAPQEEATYLDFSLSMDEVNLATVIRQLGLNLSFPVSGTLSFSVVASMPVDSPGDLRSYRARGTAMLKRVNVAGVEATQVRTRFRYRDGVLSLEDLAGQVPAANQPGADNFAGEVQVRLAPLGELTALLRLTDVPADNALRVLPAGADARGHLSGTVQVRVPTARLTDPAAWTASADVTTDDAWAYGLDLKKASVRVGLAHGVATVDELRGQLHDAPVSGFGRVRLKGAYPYEAVLNLDNADLRALQDLKPELRPPVQLRGTMTLETSFQGTLSPLTYKDAGKVQARDVIVEGITADSLSFRWETMPDRLFLYAIDARLYQGRVRGSALQPLRANVPASADLALEGVQVETFARRLLGRQLTLQGLASGTYHAQWGPAGDDGVRENTTQLDLSSPLLRVGGFGVKQVTARVEVRRGTTAYALTGSALEGKLELEGTLPRTAEPVPSDAPATGRLTLERGRLSRLGGALHMEEILDPLRGQVSLDVEYRHGPDLWPVGRGRVFFKDVRWHSDLITDAMRADVALSGGEARLSNMSGGFGGGELGGRVAFNLKNPERGHFNLTLDRAEASTVITPVYHLLTGATTDATGPTTLPLQGALQVNLRGNLGREWRGSGNVVLTRGKVYGVDVTEWRWPVSFAYNLRHGRGQVEIHDSTAQLAQGRAVGDASFVIGIASRAEGSVRFTDLDLRTLARSFGDVGSLAAGRVSGRLKFNGNQVRSLDDINATLDTALTQTQALELPVLRVLVPYVPAGTGSTTFQKGDLQARMSNGVIRVQHLSLASDLLKLVVEGTMSRQGRLNLEATTTTGNLGGLNNATLLGLAREIPAAGPIPVALIAQLSTFLAGRTVHLRIGGTLRNPTVQIEPVALLTEEAIRLILGRVNVYVP